MASTQLPNHLRSNRKRLGLSQDDLAFLLGVKGGAKVCRYERFVREPSLETALALEAIFERPVSELFGGRYQKAEQDVATRAQELQDRIDHGKTNRQRVHKRQIFNHLAKRSLTRS